MALACLASLDYMVVSVGFSYVQRTRTSNKNNRAMTGNTTYSQYTFIYIDMTLTGAIRGNVVARWTAG